MIRLVASLAILLMAFLATTCLIMLVSGNLFEPKEEVGKKVSCELRITIKRN